MTNPILIKSLFFLSLFWTLRSDGQNNPDLKRTRHWYFGQKAGLNFTTTNPTLDFNSQMHSFETGSVMSDTTGNLLFYTNGDTVWNRIHQVMPNGTGLINCQSSSQGGIIIKKPNSDNLYYVFTNDCMENQGVSGVRYSLVDISLNGGLGDVTIKNTLLYAPSTEKLSGIYHCNQQDVWLVGQVRNSNSFCSYLINQNGISNTPVLSNIGYFHNDNAGGCAGQMKFSPNGTKMAVVYTTYPNGIQELYDFNNNTGVISNLIPLSADTSEWGVSFSPDNSKLYISSGATYNKILQYDLSSNTPTAIVASRSLVYTKYNTQIFGLQLAPNGKIYCSNFYVDSMSVINNPNAVGIACNYAHNTIDLQGRLCLESLPQFIESYFNPPAGCPTFLNESSNSFKLFSIWPSPSSTKVNFDFSNFADNYADIIFQNQCGQSVKAFKHFSLDRSEIPIDDLPNGSYFVVIQTPTFKQTRKLIVLR